jgi:hypothetical protein
MRRFALTLLLVSLAVLLAGVVLGTFVLGGRGFIGFPLPIATWPRSLPPSPGVGRLDAGVDLSLAGLLVDVAVWMVAARLLSRRRRRTRDIARH